jgi:hypothetical protein
MKCERCGQAASIHTTEISAGKPVEHHYCQQCGMGRVVNSRLTAKGKSVIRASMLLEKLLEICGAQRADELVLVAGCPPMIRVAAELVTLDEPVLEPKQMKAMCLGMMTSDMLEDLESAGVANFRIMKKTLGLVFVSAVRQGENCLLTFTRHRSPVASMKAG